MPQRKPDKTGRNGAMRPSTSQPRDSETVQRRSAWSRGQPVKKEDTHKSGNGVTPSQDIAPPPTTVLSRPYSHEPRVTTQQECNCDICQRFALLHGGINNGHGAAEATTCAQKKNFVLNTTKEVKPMCEICKATIPALQYYDHMEKHEEERRLKEAQEQIRKNEENKHGIEVDWKNGIDFDVVLPDTLMEVEVNVTNTGKDLIILSTCRVAGDSSETFFMPRLVGLSGLIRPQSSRVIKLRFGASDAGRHQDTLELLFTEPSWKQVFLITRQISATIGNPADYERLKPQTPYTGRKAGPKFITSGRVIGGTRPPEWSRIPWVERLPSFNIPPHISDAAFGKDRQNATQNVRRLMPARLTSDTYAQWFQCMLYVEEEQMRRDLLEYALSGAEIKAAYPKYTLEVSGLEENRPSILIGDYILVSEEDRDGRDGNQRIWYQGRVQNVLKKTISIRFPKDFNTYRKMNFDVQFTLNRVTFRRSYYILNNDFQPSRLLFPTPRDIKVARRPTAEERKELRLANRTLQDNEEQLEIVVAILNMPPGSPPFIVFGPPGTGKTVTIVEAMQQILYSDPSARILACAPSNSAADLIALKLMHLGTSVLFRLNAITRDSSSSKFPGELEKYSFINNHSVFAIPYAEMLAKYRIVVSTCSSGGIPASLGLARGHFSHIFIDEAGQGKEPDVMNPIKSIASNTTNIILAGDNQQLGPVVHSPTARSLGLRKSYLERLMEMAIYDIKDDKKGLGGRGITIVELIKNFRSHPAILRYPNEQFYGSRLQPCGNPAMIHSLEGWDELPTRGFPIIFHGIRGKDDRENISPSFFNIDEATLVKKYCDTLIINNRKLRLKSNDIGVITPYHAQRCKIKQLLIRDSRLEDITVGSVEELQGQERRVIILSTVRSNQNYVTSDIRRSLGFIAERRRFNVALTRAQALLIVVGNPEVLSLDPLWRGFMNYVHASGGWKGVQPDWDITVPIDENIPYDKEKRMKTRKDVEEMVTRLKAMIAKKYEEDDFDLAKFDVDDGDIEEDGIAGAAERPIIREHE